MFLDRVDSNNNGANGYIDDDEPDEDDDELRDDDDELCSPNNVRSQAGATTNYSQSNGHTEFTTKTSSALFNE